MYTRRVDVFSRGEELCGLAVGAHAGLLAGPGAVAPGEEDDPEFLQDVGVGDVEVVFEGGDVYVAVDLVDISAHCAFYGCSWYGGSAYILLDILLASCYRTLAHLEAHLCRGVVDEAAKCWVHVA